MDIQHKKTRFKIAIGITAFLMIITIYAINKEMEQLATTCVMGLMVIGPAYIAGDSYRKSK